MLNTEGEDISLIIEQAAEDADVDPVYLLALIKAESGLEPYAERWGTETRYAIVALRSEDYTGLQAIINRAVFDVSFGYGQQIVKYHYYGNGLMTVANCLDVRSKVFADPNMSIRVAARQLNSCIARSMDGSFIGAALVYNSGADRRNDLEWVKRWSGNIRSYEVALEWAEAYRLQA